jgi:hypothetical protein
VIECGFRSCQGIGIKLYMLNYNWIHLIKRFKSFNYYPMILYIGFVLSCRMSSLDQVVA